MSIWPQPRENELGEERGIAATSLAIHAAINAAEAVCGVRLGKRAAGQDHDRAGALLKEAGRDGAELGKDLRRRLPLKTKAEYDADDIPLSAASKAVGHARRSVAVARRVMASAPRQ
ncbi:MAG: DNA-binding protein [Actinomycetota bacterium]|nr:DNA-binding protein [Actinomycetota bacterium]